MQKFARIQGFLALFLPFLACFGPNNIPGKWHPTNRDKENQQESLTIQHSYKNERCCPPFTNAHKLTTVTLVTILLQEFLTSLAFFFLAGSDRGLWTTWHVHTIWFELNDGNSLPHECRLPYVLECRIFNITPTAMLYDRWKRMTWLFFLFRA